MLDPYPCLLSFRLVIVWHFYASTMEPATAVFGLDPSGTQHISISANTLTPNTKPYTAGIWSKHLHLTKSYNVHGTVWSTSLSRLVLGIGGLNAYNLHKFYKLMSTKHFISSKVRWLN